MKYYYCKHCGRKATDPRVLTYGGCPDSPTGRHQLFEGGDREEYTCKHCGRRFRDLYLMLHSPCHDSPTGKHQPAIDI